MQSVAEGARAAGDKTHKAEGDVVHRSPSGRSSRWDRARPPIGHANGWQPRRRQRVIALLRSLHLA
eukprot:6385541-Pyramimonas_sp.AAC.1